MKIENGLLILMRQRYFMPLKSISFDILSRYKQHDLFKLRNASTGLPSYPDLYIIQIVMDSGY